MRRIFFYLGWVFLAAAFLAGAAEPLATSTGRGLSSLLVPAYDLWYAVAPHSLVISQIRVEKISPAIWDPVIISALVLPAWLLLGVPGALLTWTLRPHREISDEMREDLEHYRESLLIIETLSRDAQDDDTFDPDEDDNAPTHLMFDLNDSDDEDMREAYRDGGLEANYPAFDDMEEWHRSVLDDDSDWEADDSAPDAGSTEPTGPDQDPKPGSGA